MDKYRYSATSIPKDNDNLNLRIGHSTIHDLFVKGNQAIKFHAGDTALGNEIWEASTFIPGKHSQHQGDKWLHVIKLIRSDNSEENIDCWMAIVHQAKQISVLTEATEGIDNDL